MVFGSKLRLVIGVCLAGILIIGFPGLIIAVSDEELFKQKCSQCHSMERALSTRKTATGWQDKIYRMMAKTNSEEWLLEPGQITEEDAQRIINYLVSIRLAEGSKEYQRGENTKAKFEVQDEVQRADISGKLAGQEKTHVPIIQLPPKIYSGKEFEVKIRVGQISHPMLEGHYIKAISLYQGGNLIGKTELKPGGRAKADFKLTISGDAELRALIECTNHRLWESVATAKVMF